MLILVILGVLFISIYTIGELVAKVIMCYYAHISISMRCFRPSGSLVSSFPFPAKMNNIRTRILRSHANSGWLYLCRYGEKGCSHELRALDQETIVEF